MAFQTDKQKTAAMPEAAGPTDPYQAVARDRRVDRTEDLNEEEIAAVEASEMEPGFEYLDAELEPAGASAVGRTPPSVWFGPLPPKLATAAREKLLGFARAGRLRQVPRTE
jgi:hypothetical protein